MDNNAVVWKQCPHPPGPTKV